MIRQITQEDLNKILELHQKLWNSEEGGERANLSFTDLRGFNLRCANLVNANLEGANLSNVNLCGANLFEANLRKSDLSHAALYGTNLGYTNLSGANLGCTNLSHANLDEKEQSRKGTILKEPIVGYKKCKDETIVTLEIPKWGYSILYQK